MRLVSYSFLSIPLVFLNCAFAINWTDKKSQLRERTTLAEEMIPTKDSANLTKAESAKNARQGKKSAEANSLRVEATSDSSGYAYEKNCSNQFLKCSEDCWKEYPVPNLITVFTSVDADLKRRVCLDKCASACPGVNLPYPYSKSSERNIP
ncbi:hypothetical protein CH373_03560 [Leptospira perolatii]|uniref:Lipoprotein n=1 Tax=Leptospira perolatii TaxID=2023191 RepID=A0A2M9ZT58_9LEPT|nr:hypothetical protein [Leptospira perolatii]PJZ68748.1 hypothetical protein CH360_14440 [Leptospira perolatii]PJZ75103.1 hypothetical protein CH373_03560 [Leptospira perolatii]